MEKQIVLSNIPDMVHSVTNFIFSKEEPKPGDMIHFQRALYQHWGIYVGDGYLIHFTLPDWDETIKEVLAGKTLKATIRKDPLKVVGGNLPYGVYNQYDKQQSPLSAEEIVKRAESLLGLQLPYNVMKSNCEHFATMMRYGTPQEGQAGWLGFTADPEFVSQIIQKLREGIKENDHCCQNDLEF
ncbi:phospholipase A and acyltransferase 3 [Anolis carolinensis]|uniref:LRAT domain-containing protein n=1 Tax=Anolis carolinensis TaxID=28377 RepID=G1KM49_ANOCA|nr:PREDICTED: HRAS-like suppressor 3 [Anolis carolinensis]|eukprot:XP_003221514.1 PREDICTED: HRAS-like suppressor 3 [Anolis carolinensis]